jgi:response regulator RpfG family c-di-GMP phosphodiesterase
VKAFNCGAADYLTKPYHPSEILSRVGIYLLAQRLQDKVDKLREAQNDSRQKELEGLMDEFTRILTYSNNSPADVLANCLNVLKSKIEQGRNGQSGVANKKKVLKSRLAQPPGKDEKMILTAQSMQR